MTRIIVLASRNPGKARELLSLIELPGLELSPMGDHVPESFEVDETEVTFEGNAWLKAEAVCRATGHPALADDSGLEVDALDGRPGVYSARYAGPRATDAENNALLLRELGDLPLERRTARFRSVIAFAVPGASGVERVGSAAGVVEGRILFEPRGSLGFGYDPLFEPLEALGMTTAEMAPHAKNALSHRGRAARALRPVLESWFSRSEVSFSLV